MDFPLYFQKVMLLWQRLIVEVDYGFFRVFGPYFIAKSLATFRILIFGLWSFIPPPYNSTPIGWSQRCMIFLYVTKTFKKMLVFKIIDKESDVSGTH